MSDARWARDPGGSLRGSASTSRPRRPRRQWTPLAVAGVVHDDRRRSTADEPAVAHRTSTGDPRDGPRADRRPRPAVRDPAGAARARVDLLGAVPRSVVALPATPGAAP